MATWMVRAGRTSANEDYILEHGYCVIGFSEVGDLSAKPSREQIAEKLRALGHTNENAVNTHSRQIYTFVHKIKPSDTVAVPLRSTAAIALGEVIGDYEYDPSQPEGRRHRRRVKWIREAVPRSAFGQDLLYSLGAFLTVCRIQRNDADKRIHAIMSGQPDPGRGERLTPGSTAQGEDETSESDTIQALSLERYGRDRIASIISSQFAGHNLTDLVNAILEAQGYHTIVSPAGPDGGVDILAGAPPLGFGSPRICVQVKTGEADAPMLQGLHGAMQTHNATHGLFVAWGGFKRTVRTQERQTFFQVRLWDSDVLISELIEVYPQLPASIREAIPLTQVWTIVEEDSA